ncbi:hypothetical protein M422DRAFT_262355 [Sphaerobolus stellatus SS14]|uniref:Uncharacterized protein n=1 Tax=Sphaerobolus stellatus (strain SS14) TaxID=990650 RepID=A0A0C9TY31_SPHS4|nr:hypothetical protein M422DRAFT_262355 [Sphaerobolus stellatus SS14]
MEFPPVIENKALKLLEAFNTQSILNHTQPLEIAIKRSELATVNGTLNLNNISEGFLLAGQHRRCAFQMFAQEKENSIQDIKLDQDAWARHKLFGNDDAPSPQMKGPVALTSADDPAGNEYIKIIQDIVDNARYWLVKVYDLAWLDARLKELNYYLENTPTQLTEHNCSSIDAIVNKYGLYTHSLADAPSRTAFCECMKSYWQDMCLQQDLDLKLPKECPTWFILTPNALGAIMNHLELVEYGVIKLASWICPWVWTKPNSKGQPYHLKCASGILLDALTKVGRKEEAVNYLFDIHGPQLIPFSELVNKYLRERNISIRNLSKYAAQQRRVRMKESWGPEKYSIFWDWLKTVFQHFSQSNTDEEFIPLEYFEEMFPPLLQDDCTHTLRHLICSKTFPLIKLIVSNKKSPAYIQDMIFKTYAVAQAHGKDLIHLLQESDDTHGKYVVEFVDFRVNKAIEAKNKRSMAQRQVKLLQKAPGYMKYNDHGKLLFDTELQQHLDAMILCMYKNVTEQFPACASDGHSRPPTILSLSQKTGSTAKTFPLTANHVIDRKTYEQGDPSSQSDASMGVQPHNIFLPGDKSVGRTTLNDTSAFEQQCISDKKFNSYSRANLQESNGSLHNSTLQDSVSTMDPTAAASFEECGTNSHVAPMMPNNQGSDGVMPGAVTSSHKGLKHTLSQSSIESLGSSNTHQRQHNTYESNSDDQPDLGSQCSTISSHKRPK